MSKKEFKFDLIEAYALRASLIVLEKSVLEKEIKINALEQENRLLADENARLNELLKLQQQRQFGKKSEAASAPDPAVEKETPEIPLINVPAHTRTKNKVGRLLDTRNLQRYTREYDLSEAEKTCAGCNEPLHCIGEDRSEHIEVIPKCYCTVESIRKKYACRTCQTVLMAKKPLSPIPKAIAGASLLTDVIIDKYQFHLPLYRQSKIMHTLGVHIPDNTLGNWVSALGEGLSPVYEAMWQALNKCNYLQVDETPVKILEPDKKGFLWVYYAPHLTENNSMIVFELSETRSADVPENRLRDFKGIMQTDGYSGYHALRKREGIVGVGCFTHARRKFSEVVKSHCDVNGIAAQLVEKMKPLYALEARMRENNLPFRTRKNLRQRIAYPLVKDIHRGLRAIRASVSPKSQLGQAINYMLKQWPYLILYLRHGEAEIDTNGVENKIRSVALGRKNWLFMGNKDSGKNHAIFYSLVISCLMNGINPRVYLHYLISKLHEIRLGSMKPTALLPNSIDLEVLKQFADNEIGFAKILLNTA